MTVPIAIVGIGCRFAGAADVHEFWKMTLEGRTGFGPVPPDRWNHDQFFDANVRSTDKSYAPNGGFIDDIRSFPALTLGIPPRRVEVMDPQQRFSIEMALAAIQDAGYKPRELPRRTGVYVGVTAAEWRVLLSGRVIAQFMASGTLGEAPEDLEALRKAVANVVPSRPFSAPGILANMIAAAVAQELDLHGPAFTTDAACASAMVAVATGVAALQARSIDCAVAGGVYLCITPEHHIAFSRIGAISKSGHCRPFDAGADGFVQGDGAGSLVLKRLDDAQRDGDRIYAVIRSIATNNDGRGDGPMAPVLAGQVEVIRTAWEQSGLDPAQVGYIETHGTGTTVGDATELTGLMQALGDDAEHAALGSSKANVGHTMAAAGVAGLIRAALAVHHGQIPPMAAFESSKGELGLDSGPFHVPTKVEPWTGQRIAGVSSFGFGGTNGHAVLSGLDTPATHTAEQTELLLISAGDPEALRHQAAALAHALRADQPTLAGVARALAVRTPLSHRLALVASSLDEAIEQLSAFAVEDENSIRTGIAADAPSVAFLFPGQGAQRIGMLRDAAERFPIVAKTLDQMEQALTEQLDIPLTHLLFPERRTPSVSEQTAAEELTATERCQPVMFACSLALSRLLQSVGVTPKVTAGHSLGEFNAAVTSGVVGAEQAAHFVARRGRAMASVSGDRGTMAAVMADRDTVLGLLAEGTVIANLNHPRQIVVSGTTEGVAATIANATAAEVSAKPLPVSHAFHSPIFADMDSTPWFEGVQFADPTIPLASGIQGHPYANAAEAKSIWARHTRSPVDFVGALEQCREAGANLYLQVGAGGPLASFARGSVGADAYGVQSLGNRHDDDGGRSLLEGLGWLWVNGVDLDPRPITATAKVYGLPAEVLPRERYWGVKSKAQKALTLKATATEDVAAQEIPAPAPIAKSSDDEDAKVMAVIAKVSAYPIDALKPTMTLADDLGFDSLMVGDMATGLAEAFPGLGGIPQELLINGPTVADIIDFVKNSGDAATTVDDDAPLDAYAPCWIDAALHGEQPRDLRRRTALLVGAHPGLGSVLETRGMTVTNDTAEPADLIVWRADGDQASALIALLAKQIDTGAQPDLLVVRDPHDVRAESLAGVARTFGAERGAVSKCIHTANADPEALVAEWLDADRTPDVKLGHTRQIAGFTPAERLEPIHLGKGDTVLITGGTRGIGLQLAHRLMADGCEVVLVGRSAVEVPGAHVVTADVTDRSALLAATAAFAITAVIHAAGVLADGAIEAVDAVRGDFARSVKVDGWENALAAAPNAKIALGIGSWAGRFGNRHQAHYAAANALMAGLSESSDTRTIVAEFGPWSSSDMVKSIPSPIQGAMRAEGVDFVGDEAGMNALFDDLSTGSGIRTHGRDLPLTTRLVRFSETLSTETHPFLLDHAIEGTPVLPLASATDLIVLASGLAPPFELFDLRLFQGVTVKEPTRIEVRLRGDRAEVRVGPRNALAYRARIRRFDGTAEVPDAPIGGDAPDLSLEEFYSGVTFHGPLLQGITSIDAIGEAFVRGRVRTGRPSDWVADSNRSHFSVDPLALDSAMQLSGYVAWTRFERAGTPVGIGRLIQLAPLPEGELLAEVHFGEREDNRFSGTLVLRALDGNAVLVAHDTVAELRKLASDALEGFEIQEQWVDFSTWPDLKDLDMRLQMAEMSGIRNPYFSVHDGTARNTTQVEGRELINFSSYNYLGFSGDPRVVATTQEAVARYGTSVSASRVASGERSFHGELEALLAKCQDVEDALVFTAGHATNVTTIGHLMGAGDLVMHDELIHDSIIQGIKLSGCARRVFKHDDAADLESQLAELRTHYEKVLIVVEGVYSMDGDICDLPAFIALKKKYGCLLMCDEAHSFGVIGKTGCGAREHYGVAGSEVDIWMGTLSKSVASCGGWIGGTAALIRYLKYTAPGFVYSAGITAANGMAALKSLQLMVEEPWRVEKLQHNAQFFHDELERRGIDTGPALGGSAVVPTVTGNSLHALFLSQRLNDQGINVQPIIYPAVADDAARLRFFLSSTHSEDELRHTAECVATTLAAIREEFPAPK